MKKINKKMILLVGGGTAGSVSPLLAIFDELKSEYDFFWIGTKKGPEKIMVAKEDIPFRAIASGKLRRYFSWRNFFDPFLIFIGFIEACFLILKQRPALVFSAGSFVAVPVSFAAWLLRIPVVIHQQDLRPGLANKIIAPIAAIITVTFKDSLATYGKKAILTGNPIRQKLLSSGYKDSIKMSKREALSKLGLNNEFPVTLVLGGGTGAIWLNKLIKNTIKDLAKFTQVIHLCGKGKLLDIQEQANYRQFEFLNLEGMVKVFNLSDIVVSRAGMGVLSELSILGKPTVLIPIPDSHQEENAHVFGKTFAAVVLNQKEIKPFEFSDQIYNLLRDKDLRATLALNIRKVMKDGANKKIADIIQKIIEK